MRIALIGCSAKKADLPAAARELYRGDLFRAALRYAEVPGRFDDIYVLSAKHGLVGLDDPLDPYDARLGDLEVEERAWWAHDVLAQLAKFVPEQDPARLVVLAGADYAQPLEWQMPEWPEWRLVLPLKGLGIGNQKAWLAREARPPQ